MSDQKITFNIIENTDGTKTTQLDQGSRNSISTEQASKFDNLGSGLTSGTLSTAEKLTMQALKHVETSEVIQLTDKSDQLMASITYFMTLNASQQAQELDRNREEIRIMFESLKNMEQNNGDKKIMDEEQNKSLEEINRSLNVDEVTKQIIDKLKSIEVNFRRYLYEQSDPETIKFLNKFKPSHNKIFIPYEFKSTYNSLKEFYVEGKINTNEAQSLILTLEEKCDGYCLENKDCYLDVPFCQDPNNYNFSNQLNFD